MNIEAGGAQSHFRPGERTHGGMPCLRSWPSIHPSHRDVLALLRIHFFCTSWAGRHLARVPKMCTWRSCAQTEEKPLWVCLAKAGFLCLIKSSGHTDGISSSLSLWVGGRQGGGIAGLGSSRPHLGARSAVSSFRCLPKFSSSLPLKKQHVFCLLESFHWSCHLPHRNNDTGWEASSV